MKGLPWWYQLLTGCIAALSITGLWLTFLADPGALVPAASQDDLVQQLDAGLPVPDSHLYVRDSRGVWMKRTQLGRAEAWAKYCTTCNVWRPPRSHHCSQCGVCMERWDHHCGVVGNCIAKRNHRFFAGFLVAAQIGCISLLGGIIWRLQLQGGLSMGQWIGTENFFLIFLGVVYGYHAMVLLFGTSHCLSIIFDITTKDVLTDRQLWRSNPPCCPGARSPASLVRIWHSTCCGPFTFRQQHTWRALPDEEAATSSRQHGAHGLPSHQQSAGSSSDGGRGGHGGSSPQRPAVLSTAV